MASIYLSEAAQAYAGARPASASVGRSTRGVSTPGMLPPSRPTSASVATRSTGLPSTYSAPTAGTTPTYRQLHGDGGFNNHQEVWGSRDRFNVGIDKYAGDGVPFYASSALDYPHLRSAAPLQYPGRDVMTNHVPFSGPVPPCWVPSRTTGPDFTPQQQAWITSQGRPVWNATELGRHGYKDHCAAVDYWAKTYYRGGPPLPPPYLHPWKQEVFSSEALLRGKYAQSGYVRQTMLGNEFRRRPYAAFPMQHFTAPGRQIPGEPVTAAATDAYGPILDKPVRSTGVFYLNRVDPWNQGGINSYTPSVDVLTWQRVF